MNQKLITMFSDARWEAFCDASESLRCDIEGHTSGIGAWVLRGPAAALAAAFGLSPAPTSVYEVFQPIFKGKRDLCTLFIQKTLDYDAMLKADVRDVLADVLADGGGGGDDDGDGDDDFLRPASSYASVFSRMTGMDVDRDDLKGFYAALAKEYSLAY